MTSRCQSCLRVFPGDVCPGCGFDHVIHIEVTEAERTSEHPEADPRKRRKRCWCGRVIPKGRGVVLRCEQHQYEAQLRANDRYMESLTPEQRRALWRRRAQAYRAKLRASRAKRRRRSA